MSICPKGMIMGSNGVCTSVGIGNRSKAKKQNIRRHTSPAIKQRPPVRESGTCSCDVCGWITDSNIPPDWIWDWLPDGTNELPFGFQIGWYCIGPSDDGWGGLLNNFGQQDCNSNYMPKYEPGSDCTLLGGSCSCDCTCTPQCNVIRLYSNCSTSWGNPDCSCVCSDGRSNDNIATCSGDSSCATKCDNWCAEGTSNIPLGWEGCGQWDDLPGTTRRVGGPIRRRRR